MSRTTLVARIVLAAVAPLVASAGPAHAQQTVSEVLSFLVTNRSIATDDFVRDEQAAIATRDTISRLLAVELATLPVSTSSGGFVYRLDSTLGTVVRSSDSFGPFFTERSLTAGRNRAAFGLSVRSTLFDTIDGRSLRDGTLVSTASTLRGEATPFDIETMSLRIRADTVTFTANYGLTDRLDVSAAVPFVRVRLRGSRVDNYRGREVLQATGSASASGLGDVVVRAKFNLLRDRATGLAVGGEARLPTGDEANLLGAGEPSVAPRLMASYEGNRVGVHGEVGYAFSEIEDTLGYAGALTFVAAPRLTLVGEVSGRRFDGLGRLTSTTLPHPRLTGVDTIRLTSVEETANRIVAVAGFKWNVGSTWLMTANVLRPLTDVGLNATWVPTVTFDYSFGR